MAHLYLRRQISGISITAKSGCSVSARRSASAASRFLGCKDPWEEKIYYARSQVPAPVQHRVEALGIPALQNRPRARSIKNKYYGLSTTNPPQRISILATICRVGGDGTGSWVAAIAACMDRAYAGSCMRTSENTYSTTFVNKAKKEV